MNKLQLLRRVIPNIYTEPTAFGGSGKTTGIRPEGRLAFRDLVHSVFESPQYLRGTTFDRLFAEMLGIVPDQFDGCVATEVGPSQVQQLEGQIDAWLSSAIGAHELYIPCAISPWPADPFSVGPVRFFHLDTFSRQEGADRPGTDNSFRELIDWMRDSRALWLAKVEVDGCIQERAEELGNIAVDLAVTSVQLVVPPGFGAETMARLEGRTAPRHKRSVIRSDGILSVGSSWLDPGMSIGRGTLASLLASHPTFLRSAGNRISAFLHGNARLPKLDRAWSDAAYWFHEGMAEPLDTLAVAKLETALEVLMGAANLRGSESRTLAAIAAFHGQKPNDSLLPNSDVTIQGFVKRFVEDRSRILHGTRSTLGSHLRDSRPLLTHLANSLLRHYAVELDDYAETVRADDTVDAFIAWVQDRRDGKARTHPGGEKSPE